ncbi:ABC transporter ATP-binding protein [Nitrospina watsonii]|uniref:Glutathione import ATP-binding protein GsiA n=1 Tax=Nitrospina watsonii TaxID=1323948 RepID=A0ABM9HEK8_9BACT|nr:dipeptide ABC transporter ATP-binding protein [Nitrospina watsonii]CAI2718488.1 Glutathione import ATP-binding protein GsiA [Nitrospina watsonii]
MMLEVKDLRTYFRVGTGQVAEAVDGVSFGLERGKTLALVGESGCGKSQTAFSIMRLIADNGYHPSGKIYLDGRDLTGLDEESMRRIRGNDIGMIFQEPMTSLNPLYRISNQLEEALRIHRQMQKGAARQRAIELLDQVGIPDPGQRIDDFPHQLSGGMKQRVMIAMALACEPKLLIADEPTTALDVTIQAQVLKLMADLQKKMDMAILLITHDMGVVNQMADDICIMYAGRIVEHGSREAVFRNRAHPYTRRLFDSIPKPGDAPYLLNTIPGMVPPATEYGEGSLFADRCQFVMDVCRRVDSPIYTVERGHTVRCHLYESQTGNAVEADAVRIPAPPKPKTPETLLSIKALKTWFPVRKGVFRTVSAHVKAVDHVDLDIQRGSTVALVGESGCGKTTLGESILRLNRDTRGSVRFKGQDLMALAKDQIKALRKYMQIIFQDPFGSLSPRMRIEDIVGEGLDVHFPHLTLQEKKDRIGKALQEVGLGPAAVDRYPHEFSGGQRQRISIARSLILEPEFLVLDEPTSALDVSVQAQVLNLLRELQSAHRLTYLFITHNLSVVEYMADVVAIMYLGRIVEYAPAKNLFARPLHPYTQTLLNAVPTLGERKPFEAVVGDVPSPLNPPQGCHFHPRCPIFRSEPEGSPLRKRCLEQYPDLEIKDREAYAACHAVG